MVYLLFHPQHVYSFSGVALGRRGPTRTGRDCTPARA